MEKSDDPILTDTVQVLSLVMETNSLVSRFVGRLSPKKWMTSEVCLVTSSPLNGHAITHCPTISDDRQYEPLDDVISVRYLEKSKKSNVLDVMFPGHSLLLSFDSKSKMELWYSELLNVTSTILVFLMKSTNRTMKLGYYLLQFYLDKMILYTATNKEVAWVWNVSHIHSYKHRKDFSQVELVVSRYSSNHSGYFTFTGKRFELVCQQMQVIASRTTQYTVSGTIQYSRMNAKQSGAHTHPGTKCDIHLRHKQTNTPSLRASRSYDSLDTFPNSKL